MPSIRPVLDIAVWDELIQDQARYSKRTRERIWEIEYDREKGKLKRTASFSAVEIKESGGIINAMYMQYRACIDDDARLIYVQGIDNPNTRGQLCLHIGDKEKVLDIAHEELRKFVLNTAIEYQISKAGI